jgi:hypothetical protein
MADVELQLGLVGSNLLKEARQVRDELAQVQSSTVATKKALHEAFTEGAKSVENFEKELRDSLKVQMEQKNLIDELNKKMKELEGSQKKAGDTATKALIDQIEHTKKLSLTIEELNAKIAARKDFLIRTDDVAKIAKYRSEISVLEKQLDQALNIGRKGFDSMGRPIKEQQGLIQRLTSLVDIYRKGINSATNPELLAKYNKKLEETQKEIQRLSNAGKTGFNEIGQKIEGAAQKSNILNKSWGFLRQAAYLIPGLGLAGVINLVSEAIVTLVSDLFKGTKAFDEFVERTKILHSAFETSDFKNAVKNVNELRINVDLAKQGLVDKEKVVKEYNETLGKSLGTIKEFNDLEAILADEKRVNAYIQATLKKAAANLALEESAKLLVKAEQERLKKESEFTTVADKAFEVSTLFSQDARGGGPTPEQAEQATINASKARKAEAIKINQDASNAQLGIARKFLTDVAAIEKQYQIVIDPGNTKETKEKTIKALQDYSNQIIALEKKLAEDRIKAMQEGREKDIAVENQYYEDLTKQAMANIGKYEREIEKTRKDDGKTAENKRKEIEQLNKLIDLEYQLQEEGLKSHTARMLAIDLKYFQDSQKAFEDAQNGINDVLLSDEAKEVASLNKKFDALIKAAKDAQKKLTDQLKTTGSNPIVESQVLVLEAEISALTEEQLKDRNGIIQKYNIKRLDEAQALAVAENDLLKIDGIKKEDLERLKEENKLKIVIDFAKKKLALLEAAGGEENQLQILQLKKLIQASEAELDQLSSSGQIKTIGDYIFDFGKSAGLWNNPQEFNDIKGAFQSLGNSLATIWTATIDARIADQQRLIDALREQLDEQQDIVDREKQLLEDGYANNYVIEERKLADLKRRNEEEKAELKKQQEEKAKAAKNLAIIQGSITAIQLAATAAGYFANSTQYGPIAGPLLALAAIATMFATFASAKQKGKEVGQYRYGGGFDLTDQTTRHSDGGLDVVDTKTGKSVANVEAGEYGYVFKNGRQAKQFEPLFNAINNSKIDFKRPSMKPGVLESKVDSVNPSTEKVYDFDELNDTMKQVERNTRKTITREVHEGYIVEIEGNIRRKIITA